MTVKREYICNFCRGTHFDNAVIHGALWSHKALNFVPKEKSENHLCETCIDSIVDANKRLLEKKTC